MKKYFMCLVFLVAFSFASIGQSKIPVLNSAYANDDTLYTSSVSVYDSVQFAFDFPDSALVEIYFQYKGENSASWTSSSRVDSLSSVTGNPTCVGYSATPYIAIGSWYVRAMLIFGASKNTTSGTHLYANAKSYKNTAWDTTLKKN